MNYSITTRELAHLIKQANIDSDTLEDDDFDQPLGESSGAGVIFGTTGGVIEAATRTAYELHTNKKLEKVTFEELRGMEGIRKASVDFDGQEIRIGKAHGLGNARKLLEDIKYGRSDFHAIEIMACPGDVSVVADSHCITAIPVYSKPASRQFIRKMTVRKSRNPTKIRSSRNFMKTTWVSQWVINHTNYCIHIISILRKRED